MGIIFTEDELERMTSISVGLQNKEGHAGEVTFYILTRLKEYDERLFKEAIHPELFTDDDSMEKIKMIQDNSRKTKKQKKQLGKFVDQYKRHIGNG